MTKLENGWYWISNPQEGDVFYPIWVKDAIFLINGEWHPVADLLKSSLTVEKAILPERN